MDFFYQSNHNKKYIYSLEKLNEIRLNSNNILDPQEQLVLFKFYHSKINQICLYFHHSRALIYNAHWLFRRVFLLHDFKLPLNANSSSSILIVSTLFSEIKIVMLSCILLAAKSNNCHMEASELAQISNMNVDLIRSMELKLLLFLDFKLFFFNPYYSLSSLLIEIYSSIPSDHHQDDPIKSTKNEKETNDTIWKEMDLLATCDAIFLLPPSLIAITLVHRHYQDRLDSWLLEQKEFQQSSITMEKIKMLITTSLPLLEDFIKVESKSIDNKKLREIDKKIKEKSIN